MNAPKARLSLTSWLQAAVPRRHIFLLSHMRAYSSLFGHILGSNPEICGYYEMHIGYYGWKSLVRQRLLYFRDEAPKPGFTYMFDKVLHNDHEVAASVLDSPRTRVIFSLRDPSATIPSIVKLYRSVDPGHPLTSPVSACRYYVERLRALRSMAENMNSDFFYFDARALVEGSEACLGELSHWLDLRQPLSSEYEVRKHTAQKRYGDTSAALQSGRIESVSCESVEVFDGTVLDEALTCYWTTRDAISQRSSRSVLLEPEAP